MNSNKQINIQVCRCRLVADGGVGRCPYYYSWVSSEPGIAKMRCGLTGYTVDYKQGSDMEDAIGLLWRVCTLEDVRDDSNMEVEND